MSLRTIVVSVVVPVGLFACSASAPEDARSATAAVTSLTGQIRSIEGLCLDVYANRQSSGAAVDIATCNGTSAQTFTFSSDTPGPIRNTASGLCLDDVWGGGQALQMVTCAGTPEQTWTFSGPPKVSKLVNGYGHCMDVLYNHQVSGQTVDPTTCNGTQAQEWAYDPPPCGPGLVHDFWGECVCDPTNYPVSVSSQLFTDVLAYPLSLVSANVTNDLLTVTMPNAASLGITPPPQSNLNIPNVTVTSLDMPSLYLATAGNWTWSVSPDSATINVSTTLDANISGSWSGLSMPWGSVGDCGVTANILYAPVSIVMTSPGASVLKVQSVTIPLSGLSQGHGNTSTSGCSAVPQDDLLGVIQSHLESALAAQLNDSVFMGEMLNGIVQGMAKADPHALNLPDAMPAGATWGCGAAALASGAITGRCERECH